MEPYQIFGSHFFAYTDNGRVPLFFSNRTWSSMPGLTCIWDHRVLLVSMYVRSSGYCLKAKKRVNIRACNLAEPRAHIMTAQFFSNKLTKQRPNRIKLPNLVIHGHRTKHLKVDYYLSSMFPVKVGLDSHGTCQWNYPGSQPVIIALVFRIQVNVPSQFVRPQNVC
jgi:hypothetical protein